ncbi:hypothetical protein HHI36_006858 [Cryptolaemus montrouzieri]|uniref:Uncharacterized protein n=1 Tax=Cryptolaemus montrouzieri TaxID=559131 RepID=A0ABD2MNR0_9CUCU
MIEKAIKDVHYSVKLNQSAKQQALQVIKLLKESIPIERAKMRIRLVIQGRAAKKFRDRIVKTETIEIENEEKDQDSVTITFLVDPGQYREIDKIIESEAKGQLLWKFYHLRK